jgi:hypothetical protein
VAVRVRTGVEPRGGDPVRMSVVLDPALAEYLRVRAFEERTTRSAYVRALVAADARLHGIVAPSRPAG